LIGFDSNDVVAWQLATRLRPWVSKCRDTILATRLPPRPATLRLQAWAQPERATELLERAWSLARQRLRRGADEYAAPLLDLATRELASLYRQQKRFDDVERCWRALAEDTRDAEAVLSLLGLLLERNQHQRVEAEWNRYRHALEGDARGLYVLARVAAAQGDKERERGLVSTALSLWPQDPDRHYATGNYLQQRGWLEWAAGEFERVLDITRNEGGLQSHQFSARLRLASIYGHRRQRDKEAEQLENAIHIYEAMQQRGEGGEAAALLVRDLKCRLLLIEAEKQEKAGDAKMQEKTLREALKLWPHHPDAVIALVALQRKRGAKEEAAALVETARAHFLAEIKKQADVAENYNNLAWLLANTDSHLEEARQLSHKSLELSPDNAAYLDTLAEVYLRLGQPQRAVELQKQAVELEPESLDLLERLKKFEAAAAAKPPIPHSKPQ
ncbi:MAG: hypothetical protein N2689_06140, partial [Verrucomicrobiae bacterium]|nr:hypothetical protein [Verrucomicrobiae bacterium]